VKDASVPDVKTGQHICCKLVDEKALPEIPESWLGAFGKQLRHPAKALVSTKSLEFATSKDTDLRPHLL